MIHPVIPSERGICRCHSERSEESARCALAPVGSSTRWPINCATRTLPDTSADPTRSQSMRKAISLSIQLWIEGEDEPAHDFAQSTSQTVREIIETGAAKYPGLAIKIRSLKEKS